MALVAVAALGAGVPIPPRPGRYVTDRAGVMAPARAGALNEMLASFERETSNQVLVYVDRRMPEGTTLEELGSRSIREWGVGQKGRSNGVVFFVFTDDRKMRIEVGYGLEGAIPDARAHRITDEVVKPLFKAGDTASGIEAGAAAILSAARGEPYSGTGKTAAERSRGSASILPFLFLFLLMAAVPIGLVLWAFRRARSLPRGAAAGSGWSGAGPSSSAGWSSSDSSSSSSSSDSSSSSSDFSGGGGDGGGGGSSDSW